MQSGQFLNWKINKNQVLFKQLLKFRNMTYPAKDTPIDHEINELIKKRWSPVTFADKPISEEVLMRAFEAARWAPSSYNEQPWMFVYANQEDENREEIEALLLEGNSWAKQAPVLIVICAKQYLDYKHKPNRHYMYDTGAAAMNLDLQLVEMGIVSHEMGGFDAEKAVEVLNLPDEHEAISVLAIGYPGESEGADEKLKAREAAPRERKKLEEFVFKGKHN